MKFSEAFKKYTRASNGLRKTVPEVIKKRLLKTLGDTDLAEFNEEFAKKFYEEQYEINPDMANRMAYHLKHMMFFLKNHGWVKGNPFYHVYKPRVKRTQVTWGPEQAEQFAKTAFTKPEWANVGLFVLVKTETDITMPELRMARWKHVNLEHRLFYGRTISQDTTDALLQQRQHWKESKFVFPNPKMYKGVYIYMTEYHFKKSFKEVLLASGLPEEYQHTRFGKGVSA